MRNIYSTYVLAVAYLHHRAVHTILHAYYVTYKEQYLLTYSPLLSKIMTTVMT